MASTPANSQTIERIAADIGSSVYIDVAKWHLYLRDARLHTLLAEAIYPILANGNLNEHQVEDVLKGIPVVLGGGKKSLSLFDLIPSQNIRDLINTLEECQRDL